MSPHRITVSPDQSSPNSGTKHRLARPPNSAKFRKAQTRSVRDIRCRKFVVAGKVYQSSPNSLKICYARTTVCQISSGSAKQCTRKSVTNFFHTLQYYGTPFGDNKKVVNNYAHIDRSFKRAAVNASRELTQDSEPVILGQVSVETYGTHRISSFYHQFWLS